MSTCFIHHKSVVFSIISADYLDLVRCMLMDMTQLKGNILQVEKKMHSCPILSATQTGTRLF